MVAVVENGAIKEGGVLAGSGGAALAPDNTNVLLSSTRMEALGLAAGMSYARNCRMRHNQMEGKKIGQT
jgi:hypothetical protein